MYRAAGLCLLSLLAIQVGLGDAADPACTYHQDMESGKNYYVYNIEYPNQYNTNRSCLWTARALNKIRLTCSIDLPQSQNCNYDRLSIGLVTKGNDTRRFCGYGNFTLDSEDNAISIGFTSVLGTPGGKFLCTMQTIEVPVDENCRCGWKKPTRIVGGVNSGINEYPMVAGLVSSQLRDVYCGATIISTTAVLTAAHCVKNRALNSLGVLVGEHDVSSGTETNATMLYRTRDYIMHPDATPEQNDIAVVFITGTIQFSGQVGPACLPFQHNLDSFAGNFVTMLGWGTLEFGGRKSTVLQKVDVSVITNVQCRRSYPQVNSNTLCTYTKGKDACQMDSGGGVLWMNPTTRNIVLVGIVSYGTTCADEFPAVHTKVGAHLDWIQSVTPGTNYCRVE